MKKLYTLLLVALAFVACDTKEPEANNRLKLIGDQPTELSFEGFEDFEYITFSSPVNWMVEMDENTEWFKVSPMYAA